MRRPLNKVEREEYNRLVEQISKAKERIEEIEKMVFGYARVSTRVQTNGLAMQMAALREAGAQKIYADKYTGASMKRPEFEKLLSNVRSGDTIIVTSLDRIARSTMQGLDLLRSLVEKGVKVNVLDMGVISKDSSSPDELFRLTMLLAFAEYERKMIMQRTREGKEIAKKNPGYRDGRPPKFTEEQRELALSLLEQYSLRQVERMTGISRGTLNRFAQQKRYNDDENVTNSKETWND